MTGTQALPMVLKTSRPTSLDENPQELEKEEGAVILQLAVSDRVRPSDSQMLQTANDGTWTALELLLAGERLRSPDDSGFSRALSQTVAALAQIAPEDLSRADNDWRQTCWQQLRAAREAGCLRLDVSLDGASPDDDRRIVSRLADALEQSSWFCLRPLLEMRGRSGRRLCLALHGWFGRRAAGQSVESSSDEDAAWERVAELVRTHSHELDCRLRDNCGGAPGAAAPPVIDAMAASLHFQRGLSSIQVGDYERAVVAFTTAIQHNPTMEAALTQRGDAHRMLGAYDRALADYTAARRINPANARVLINRGQTYRMLGRIQLALADYDVALQIDPASVIAINHRGTARAEVGDHDAAIADFSQAIAIDPDNPFTYQNRAHSFAAIGNLDAAIADYSRVLQLNPMFTLAHVRRADAYRQKEQLDRAIADYTEALRLDPLQLHAYVSRGVSYQEQGQATRALSDFEAALKLGGANPQVYLNRGIAHREDGAFDAALVDFDAALRLDPENALVYLHRALALKELGELDRAVSDLDEVLRRKPDSADAFFHRGTIRVKQRDAAAAVADLSAAIALDPNNALAYVSRGLAHSLTDSFDRVVFDCTRAIELDGSLTRALKTRGTAYYRQGDYSRALADFDHILTRQPTDVEALFNRGVVHARIGDHEAAIAGLSRALEIAPGNPRALAARATSYRVQEQDDEALLDYAQAVQYDTRYAHAYCNQRAFMHMKRGERALALADCEISLLLDPDNQNAKMLREQVLKSIPVEIVRKSIPEPVAAEPADDTRVSTKLAPIRPKKPAKPAATATIEFETSRSGTLRALKPAAAKAEVVAKKEAAAKALPKAEERAEEEPPTDEVEIHESEPPEDEADTADFEVAEGGADTDPELKAPPPAPKTAKVKKEDLTVKPEDSAEYEREQALLREQQAKEAALVRARAEQVQREEVAKKRKEIEEKNDGRRGRKKVKAEDDGSSPWMQRVAAAVAVLVLGYFVVPWVWNAVGAHSIPQDEEVVLQAEANVSAIDLAKKYQTDAAAAQAEFGDRILEVSGVVKDVKPASDNSVTIILMDQKKVGRVSCKMPAPKSVTQGTLLSKLGGLAQVTLRGKCTGKNGDLIDLEGVQLVSVREH